VDGPIAEVAAYDVEVLVTGISGLQRRKRVVFTIVPSQRAKARSNLTFQMAAVLGDA
jgi:hypothetical protein